MVFSELIFIFAFLPITLLIYYAVPFKFKNFILLLSGLVFYSWGEPVYVLIMILSTLIDYTAGRVMARFEDSAKIRKAALIVSVVMNLSLLCIFKYSGMAVNTVNSIIGANISNPNIPLPIGISFFTFQSMSYTIDLYRRQIKVQKSFVDFAAFVTMFPQIVAGPIVRYEDIANELCKRKVNLAMLSSGISLYICGLAKKVLIANALGEVWSAVKLLDFGTLSAASAWFGLLCFTFQIYFDFSGYSDMAVGLGKMLGFNFPKNFDYPYLSQSVSEFWRRWHITLGAWFRSYLYIPLGGNRKGAARTVINLLIVWFLTGLWHGASWNFVLWGVYYGVLIIIEKFLLKDILPHIPKILRIAATFLIVVFGWLIFEMSDVSMIPSFISAMFFKNGAFDSAAVYYIFHYAIIFILAALVSIKIPQKILCQISKNYIIGKASPYIVTLFEIMTFLLCIIYLVNAGYNPFLYFNF